MKTKTSLVLLLIGAAALGGAFKVYNKMERDIRDHKALIPQGVVELDQEISKLRNTRFGDVNIPEIEQKAARYTFLVSEREAIYASDPNIEPALEYVERKPSGKDANSFLALGLLGFVTGYFGASDFIVRAYEKIRGR